MMETAGDIQKSTWDITGDGVFTISDVEAWFADAFFGPGDVVLSILMMTPIGRFFEMTPDWYGGLFSGLFSAGFWLFVISLISGILVTILEVLDDILAWIKGKL